MPIDRVARDRLAQDIAQYMRGEITAFEFDERLSNRTPSSDQAIEGIKQILWCFYDDETDHRVSLSEESWDYFRRLLAFLQTDLTLERSTEEEKARPSQLAFCGLFFAVQAIAIAVSLREDSWATAITTYLLLGCIFYAFCGRTFLYLALATLGLVVAGQELQKEWVRYAEWSLLALASLTLFILWLRSRSQRSEAEPPDYSPFQDEAQWKRYEPYLERFDLPPFMPGVQDKPIRSRVFSFAKELLFIPLMPLYWPLHMLLLCRLSALPSTVAKTKR